MNIIAAQQFEGDLYIKASDHHRVVRAKVAAEREECAKVCDVIDDGRKDLSAECAEAIRARGQDPAPEPKRSSMTWVVPKIHPVMEYRFRRGRGFI